MFWIIVLLKNVEGFHQLSPVQREKFACGEFHYILPYLECQQQGKIDLLHVRQKRPLTVAITVQRHYICREVDSRELYYQPEASALFPLSDYLAIPETRSCFGHFLLRVFAPANQIRVTSFGQAISRAILRNLFGAFCFYLTILIFIDHFPREVLHILKVFGWIFVAKCSTRLT